MEDLTRKVINLFLRYFFFEGDRDHSNWDKNQPH